MRGNIRPGAATSASSTKQKGGRRSGEIPLRAHNLWLAEGQLAGDLGEGASSIEARIPEYPAFDSRRGVGGCTWCCTKPAAALAHTAGFSCNLVNPTQRAYN